MQVKPREQELRQTVHQSQGEPGLRALVELAQVERDKALEAWRRATGPDLVKFQSSYNAMQTLIDFVIVAPMDFAKRGA